MSYQVLARKWRPRSFKSMVGQEMTLRILTNALDKNRLHHAYLFTGTRGVGKTTLARIFAKCLNCEKGISSQPCDQCSTCQAIDAGRFVDLLEIDAASRTKVEDTRELLDNVHYAPTQGRYRIYLIDEVHMLSTHSFNALLKTLEEPPAHVKFLLATTDPKRLPITILSRCLQFHLKRIPDEQITEQLALICTSEKIEFEKTALQLLSHAADGSLRDALSLTDQAIAYCNEKITLSEIKQMLGYIEQDPIFRILNLLAENNGKQLLLEIRQLAEQVPDYHQVLTDLLAILHQISVAQTIPGLQEMPDAITQLAKQLAAEEVQLYYQIALIGKRDLSLAPKPAEGFEMILLRMLAFKPAVNEQTIPKTIVTEKNPAATKSVTTPAPISAQPISAWAELLPKLQLTGLAYALASNCSLVSHDDNKVVLSLAQQHEPMLNKRLSDRIEQALSGHFSKSITLEIKITLENIQTPAKQQHEEQTQRLKQATIAIKSDTHVQKIIDSFGAELDMNSIKSLETD